MDQRIGCKPFRDVLVVGRRPTLVRTVGGEPGHKDGHGEMVKGKVFSVSSHWVCLALWDSGRSEDVVRIMISQTNFMCFQQKC